MQKRKKFKIKKFFLILFFIIFLYNNKTKLYYFFINISNISGYKIIKQDYNSNYSGIGQAKVSGKDGFFTTFTTETQKTFIEYKQNGKSSWSNSEYWDGTMADNGCGITSMSIILSGYGKDYSPNDLRKKYEPKLNYDKLSFELYNSFGIKNSDFYYDSVHLSQKYIEEHLQTGRPVLVCVWNKPNQNRWTTKSHYMVLLASDKNNMIYVSNPNGLENDSKSSGWYKSDEVIPYIAKALFIESY